MAKDGSMCLQFHNYFLNIVGVLLTIKKRLLYLANDKTTVINTVILKHILTTNKQFLFSLYGG